MIKFKVKLDSAMLQSKDEKNAQVKLNYIFTMMYNSDDIYELFIQDLAQYVKFRVEQIEEPETDNASAQQLGLIDLLKLEPRSISSSGGLVEKNYSLDFVFYCGLFPKNLEYTAQLKWVPKGEGDSFFLEDVDTILDLAQTTEKIIEETKLISSSVVFTVPETGEQWTGPVHRDPTGVFKTKTGDVETEQSITLDTQYVPFNGIQDFRKVKQNTLETEKLPSLDILDKVLQFKTNVQAGFNDTNKFFTELITWSGDDIKLFLLLNFAQLSKFVQYETRNTGAPRILLLEVLRKRADRAYDNDPWETLVYTGEPEQKNLFEPKDTSAGLFLEHGWTNPGYRLMSFADYTINQYRFGNIKYAVRMIVESRQDQELQDQYMKLLEVSKTLQSLYNSILGIKLVRAPNPSTISFIVSNYIKSLNKLGFVLTSEESKEETARMLRLVSPDSSSLESLSMAILLIQELTYVYESILGYNSLKTKEGIKNSSNRITEVFQEFETQVDCTQKNYAQVMDYLSVDSSGVIDITKFTDRFVGEIEKYFTAQEPSLGITVGNTTFVPDTNVTKDNISTLTPQVIITPPVVEALKDSLNVAGPSSIEIQFQSNDAIQQKYVTDQLRGSTVFSVPTTSDAMSSISVEIVPQLRVEPEVSLDLSTAATVMSTATSNNKVSVGETVAAVDVVPKDVSRQSAEQSQAISNIVSKTASEVTSGGRTTFNRQSKPVALDKNYFNATKNNILNNIGRELANKPMQVIAVVKSSLPVKQDAAESRVDWQNTADFEVLYDGTVGKTVELQYLADIEKNVWKTLTEDIKKTVLQKNKFLMVRQLPLSDSSVRLFFSKNDIINEQYFILGASK